jgi:hypothetical protein
VHPYAVAHEGGKWFLHAREDAGDVVKRFNLVDASSMSPDTPGSAEEVPAEFSVRQGSRFSRDPLKWQRHDSIPVQVLTSPADLPDVLNLLATPGFVVGDAEGSGPLDLPLEITVLNLDGFLARLIELGPRVRLVGPPEVRRALRDRLAWARRKQQ